MGCESVVIGDEVYETVIKDLIKSGEWMRKCTHGHPGSRPCELCQTTWLGCMDNAQLIMRGLKKRREEGKFGSGITDGEEDTNNDTGYTPYGE